MRIEPGSNLDRGESQQSGYKSAFYADFDYQMNLDAKFVRLLV
ncbi:MAG: hypothetical protein ACJAS9_001855 [Polaribacter sp.]|jgi:hypothetical protein